MSLKKPLIVVKYETHLSPEIRDQICDALQSTVNNLGAEALVFGSDFNVEVHDNSLHESINSMAQRITELVESNDRLTKALIESYSEPEDEEVPRTYMDGSPIKGYQPNETLKSNPPSDE